jgi:hypothetical protein
LLSDFDYTNTPIFFLNLKKKRKDGRQTKKIQTDKNVERVQNRQQNTNRQNNLIDYEINFDLCQIIIQNASEIVAATITKIPILHQKGLS